MALAALLIKGTSIASAAEVFEHHEIHLTNDTRRCNNLTSQQ